MNIQIGSYKLIQREVGFDLIQTIKSEETVIEKVDGRSIRTKTGKLIDRDIDLGYNMTLESCVNKIIMTNILEKEGVTDLLNWVKLYREEREKITNILN